MAKILITGGTGLVGRELQTLLINHTHEVVILSRNPKNNNEFYWDIHKQIIDEKAFIGITHIIHLAGAGIADSRWTEKRKKEIIDSRVASIALLFSYVKKLNLTLNGFISASGIGYYGAITSDKIFAETDQPKKDFISKVCVDWEEAAQQFQTLGVPVTIFRTGIVLSKDKGALSKINTPLFLSALGNGKQYMPWIHIFDLCKLYLLAVENSQITGIYNAVAPEHQTNQSFTKILSKTIGKPMLPLAVPSFLLQIMFGELADILLYGSRVSTDKTETIYTYRFRSLSSAFEDLYT